MLSVQILTSAFLFSTLVQFSSGASDLQITNVTSPTSAQLVVTWTSTSSSISYFLLELRVVNNTAIALVSSIASAQSRSKLVQGLRAGTLYNVTLKSYTNTGAVRSTSVQAETVPATPVITSTNGISSSEISLTWNPQVGVDYYFVMVSMGSDSNNKTFAGTLNGTVDGLQPSTVYNLTLYAVNSAGPSAASRRVSVYTLTQAPGIVSVTPVSSSSVTLTWTRVDNALMYGIFVYEEGPINNLLYIMKTTTSTITLNNLQPCTKYILNVASYNWFYVIGGKAEVPYKYGNLDPPQGITIQYSSYMQSALISWVPSTAASIYVATATSDRGHVAICNTSTTSCEIQDLHCEQKYVVSVVAQTGTCYSNSSKESTVETAPCAPENITVTGDCQVNTIMLQWSPAIDAIQYTAYALTSDHQMLECRNVVPNCFFINLLCGTEYEMSVMATSAKINSSRSHGIKARTAPCDPGNVAAVPNCNSSVLDVSWGLSNGANTYIALAQGSSGHTYNCSSVSTGCQITGVQCGDSLSVTVIAYDNYCSSWSSSTDEIVTAPCTPTIITTETDCNSQSSSVQWMYSQGAILYMARAVSAIDNSEYFCQTSDLRCTLTDLPCGQMFTVSVKANNFQCDSASSQEVEIYSVPCIPNSVSSELDCTLNTVLVQWSPDSVNTTYTATIEEKGIGFHSCATQESYCVVRDLSCGQNYSVSVKADNGQCTSTSEWTAPSLTAPCKPTEIKANSICYNNSMQMTWSKNQAFGIDMYLVQMHSPDGQQRACQSTSEACITEAIECGTIYEATVTAVSVNCESKSSTIYTVPVPCSPKQLTDTVAPDFVVLTWNSVPGALNYTTEIAGGGIERHICTTINTSCSMTDLLCGHQYSMIVTAAGKQCNNVSDTHQFQTAPCVPQNVLASLDCTSNVVTVSWNSSLGANNYTTKAEGTDGQTYFCNSTSTFCDIAGLKCGHSYQVTVEAANEKSKSGPSIPVPIETAPCVPVADSPQLHCNNTVSLAWATTLGANNYVSNVTAPQGQPLSCATSDTGCIISSLQCGQVYNVTVTALNAKCSSPASPPSSFTTAPCTPQNVVTKLDCITNVATVSWDSSAGAELYTANVVGGNENLHSCNTTSLSCDIMGLTCGQMYTATVTAANEICKSKPSSEAQIQTAPCAPEQQPPQLNCETNTATLSWGQTLGAAQYVSNVTAPGEQPLSCATENNSCTISELKCGLIYNATVTAINNQCRGPESTTTTIITVPCQPQNLIAAMNCTSSITLLDWDESAGALGYTSILSAPGGEQRFCNSTTGHCEVRNLQCGQLYTVFVKAHNVQCDSTPSASAQLHSVPCVPSNVQTQINCELDSATLTWDATNGALSYSATVMGPQNEEYFCQTANLLCRFPTLSCGLEYNATILAVGDTCNSDASAPLPFQSVPCAATELNMQYECNKDTAELSWASTLGAIMYTASINTQDGTTLQCNTTGTSCVVTGIKCGQRYTMAVETFDTTCSSKAISPNQFLTAPCIPKNITSTINCQDNSALLSWSRAPGALNYSSLVTGPNGEHQTCQTDSTTCNISALTCGFTYNATVTAFNSQCKGENSEVVHIVTAPCAPENVIAVIDCTLSTVTLSWEEVVSAQSFTSYLNGPDNWIKTCSNTLPTCNITGLPCGLQFSATVSAANSHCVGPLSNPVEVISAPCMAVNVYTTVECTDNSVDIFWDRSNGSLNYTSSVLGAGGQQYHCSTEDLSCRVPKLHCGEVYSVIVFAENDICSSQPSHAIEFPSSPCTPINLVDQVFINLVVLSWGPTPGALNYTTQVAGVNGEKHVCSTSNTNCSLQGLLCGQHYNMSVTAIGPLCSNISDLHEFQTGPCTPLNVIAEIDCVSNTGLISWDSSPGAENYKAVANGTAEDIHTCNSTSTSCDFFGLKCGTTYSVVVIAANEKSNSKPSSPVELKTAPCVPVQNPPQITCRTNVATLSWTKSLGADSYNSSVTALEEKTHFCSTENQECNINGLMCGRIYSVTVSAINANCSSPLSVPSNLTTVPCQPQNVTAQIDCSRSVAHISWDSAPGALHYTSTLRTSDGTELMCNSSDLTCEISSLQCGQVYTVTVMAFNDYCASTPSFPVDLHSVPCVPTEVHPEVSCESNIATVQWAVAKGAVNYTVTVTGPLTEKYQCQTANTSCSFPQLSCGLEYNASVVAVGHTCSSDKSAVALFHTVPCVPSAVQAGVNCDSNLITVTWNSSLGALNYSTVITGPAGDTHVCQEVNTMCSFSNLSCGLEYNTTVSANGYTCSSHPSAIATIHTVPCRTTSLNMQYNCNDNNAELSWKAAVGALGYTTTVSTQDMENVNCSTRETSCIVYGIKCGQIYTMTVESFGVNCNNNVTSIMTFPTAPCVPKQQPPQFTCDTNTASLSWGRTLGAARYISNVTAPNVETLTCETSDMTCNITDFHCGQVYTAIVSGINTQCRSLESLPTTITTVPCQPQNVTAKIDCTSSVVSVSWDIAPGALRYSATLKASGGEKLMCNSTELGCQVKNLQCGQMYAVTVTAFNEWCQSASSSPIELVSDPCSATDLKMQYNCNDNNAELSWKASLGALGYTATVSTQDMENVNCSTREIYCIVDGIKCGQIYTMTVETFGINCNNNVTSTVTFPTAPCVPEQQPSQFSCDTNTASLSWGRTLGAARYISNVTAPNVETLTCETSDMTCNITDFHCGQVYTAIVSGINPQCRSLESLPTTITTVPCQPQNVTAKIDCTSSVASVSWDVAPGALRYSATLKASGGEKLMCNSTELGCQVKNLQCGQIYVVTVTAFNEWCQSASSSPIELESVPCVPTQVLADISCESNVVNVSWTATPGAMNFTATISGPQGQQFILHALNRACTFPRLSCGTEYNATIVALGNTCSSASSQPISVQTVPCQPRNVSAQMICSRSVASVTWHETAGALRYSSTLTSSRGVEFTCNSTELGCEVSSLQCGEAYTVIVSAINNECEGTPSLPAELLSVPCVPSHVQATVSCEANATILSWAAAEGAVNYIGLLSGPHGDEYECQEVGTSCNFTQLSCGLEYNATVFAVGHSCSSSYSEAVAVYTAPCVANNLHTQYKCGDNHAELSWGATLGALMYIASVTSQDGETLYCNSTTTSCVVSNIQCGKKYNMAVETFGKTCRSKASVAGSFTTGTCVPQNFTAVTDCADNSAILSWSRTPGALNYTALARGPNGKDFTCDTESTTCRIPALHCGFTYNVSVRAFNEQCVGESSTIVQLITAPCVPDGLQAEVSCVSSSLTLSWEQMADAHSFQSYLTGHGGLTQTCNSTEKKCVFLNLPCGQIYSATVSASNSQCTGPISKAINIETAPCTPTAIRIDPLCGTTMESLWWDAVAGADMYYAEMTGVNEWTSECVTQNRTCDINGLECGQPYSITLTASNSRCNSTARPVTFYTAPCVPSNVSAAVVCGMNTVDISWSPTKGALNYTATVVGPSEEYSCSAKELTCNAELPECGQTYTVTVTALHDLCSTDSLALEFHSAPCRPENVAAIINCDNNTASVTWDSAAGAQRYISNISGPNGEAHSCTTTQSTCDVSGMRCGHIYNVTVTAVNEQCSNESSVPAQLKTGPCVPQILDVNFKCASDIATLSWGVTPGTNSYEATLTDSIGRVLTCNTTDKNCDIKDLTCGENYNATVIALNDQCTSGPSPTVMVHAVPCPPDNITTSIYHAIVKPQEVKVSWSSSHCGIEYMAIVQGGIKNDPDTLFTLESYWTSYMEFYIPVPCSSSFNATVVTRNGAGESYPSVPVQGYTAPCPPQVNVPEVSGATMRISWLESVNAEEYRVLNAATNATLCETAILACDIPFTETDILVIAVNLSGESNPTILSGYNRTSTP